jgi:hypothetical protein
MMAGMDKHPTLAHRAGETRTLEERRKVGLSMRQRVPRSAQAEWTPPADRADPVAIPIEQGKGRIQELLPVRYARMKVDPFAFLRGAAAVMAADEAIGKFAMAYADQTDRDWNAFLAAIKAGRIIAGEP